MIRKSGVVIFLALLSIVLVLVYFFSGVAIRAGLVAGLEKFAGAEVNVARVSLSFSPLALDIQGIQITDKYHPELNLVSLQRAHADLELWPALMGYYVIDELAIEGLAYQSQRKSPGKVYASKSKGGEDDSTSASNLSDVLKLDIPSAEELLAKVDLQTLIKGQALKAEAEKQKQALQALESTLPSKQKLLDLQSEIKVLTESKISDAADLAKKADQLKTLREQLKQERDTLNGIKEQVSQSRQTLSQTLSDVKKAKEADWDKLQSLANIKDGGLAPISQLLLGDVWAKRITQLQAFYDIAKPYIPDNVLQGSGKTKVDEPKKVLVNRVLPITNKPYPNFWVKSAKVDWMFGGGSVDIRLQDITAEHALINRSTQFTLDTKGLPKLAALNVKGDFAVRQKMVTNITWVLDKLTLDPVRLGANESLSFADGLLNSTGTLKLVNDTIEQKADVVLKGAKFSSTSNKTMEKLATVLSQQSSIPISVNASGAVGSPSVSVRSQLDRIIGDAVLAEAKEKVTALELKLRKQLDQKLKEQLAGQGDWLNKLDLQDKSVLELEGIIEDALKAELQDVKGQAKDKLKDKLLKFGK